MIPNSRHSEVMQQQVNDSCFRPPTSCIYILYQVYSNKLPFSVVYVLPIRSHTSRLDYYTTSLAAKLVYVFIFFVAVILGQNTPSAQCFSGKNKTIGKKKNA